MEDVVPEAESLLHPPNHSGDDAIEERQNPEAAAKEGENRDNGLINQLISNLVASGDSDENKQAGKETIPGGGKDGEKGGGLLDHIISNLVTPVSPKTGNTTQGEVEAFDGTSENQSVEEVGGGGGGAGSGGGLINNIVSNLFHHSEGEVVESREEKKKKEMVKVGKENKAEKTEDGGGGGGGGIIDNIVSHMPKSLPDDAAPTSDEATILIHIVQD
ncbi:hypothetical protein PTKIN_Ptkin06aG0004100 [Pterospermum kingtungense]